MLCTTVPQGVRALADRYKDLFCGPAGSYSNLCALISFFVLSKSSLSELVRDAPWTHSVSDLSRAVLCFDRNRFMRRLRRSILRRYKGQISSENFCWAIDDTDNPKYGRSVFRAGNWHGSKGPYHGQKVMVLALVDFHRGVALPVAYIIAPKKDDPAFKPAPELAIDLLQEAVNAGFAKLAVALDSWFDSVDLIKKIETMGFVYVGELKSNRNVKQYPGPYVGWGKFEDLFADKRRSRAYSTFDSEKIRKRLKRRKSLAQTRSYITNRRSPLNVIAVYNRRNSKKAFGYYASTDLSMSGSRIWEITRARWKIECLFRDLKQNLSFGGLPMGGEKAADLSVCLPFLILISLRLDGKEHWHVTSDRSIGEMTDQVKGQALAKAIQVLIQGNDLSSISRLKARRHNDRLNKKPVNSIAEAA